MRPADRSDLWWRSAVIYCLDIKKYQDSDGDGLGDIDGLLDRIEYLADLGVTCLWLMPFQPTPDRDDGYDVTDYFGVDSRLGDLGRFVELIRVAHDRGIRVIIDLVINHTSDQHPWFVNARSSRDARLRDFYVWQDEPTDDAGSNVFPTEEDGVWQYDEQTGQYYLHHFHHHQPDLNHSNPEVRSEISRILGFWLELGADGFRIDAVPFLIHPPGAGNQSDPHAFLRELRRFVARRYGGAALLGEVGLDHQDQLDYFGNPGVELDLQFDFETAEAAFLSFVRHDPAPLATVLRELPAVDVSQGWASFLRTHDELNLELLGDAKEEVFEALSPDPRQRVYGRGIVRRLAPMLGGDQRRLRLAYSLLFSLPGAPVLYYGEEIGMGEPAGTEDRSGVRTPMQWHSGRNGGFSTARRDDLVEQLPEGDYGPERVNVYDQLHDPDSLLSFLKTLIGEYRATPEIAFGDLAVLETGEGSALAHAAVSDGAVFVALHNFADHDCTATVDVGSLSVQIASADFHDLLQPESVTRPENGQLEVELGAYGFRWLRATRV
ncbi:MULTISPECIES: alpha-amylase family glycosyl hydrolase [unclassified Brachybacterium]|uniref:alpha-amylase family glycosyl hydrolase n=1 Tax=unclassified Brachybacterium TaxID=2623841 RepID=UPI00361223CD